MTPFSRFYIQGKSMQPTFQPNDRVLVWRWGTIRHGDVVVFCKNGMKMVKRAVEKKGDRWLVRSDNYAESTDSLDFGTIKKKDILGKVVAKY